jgi:hypothetical protein
MSGMTGKKNNAGQCGQWLSSYWLTLLLYIWWIFYHHAAIKNSWKWKPAVTSEDFPIVRYQCGGSMELNARILLLAYMVYL